MQKCIGTLRSGRLFFDVFMRVQLSEGIFLTLERKDGRKDGRLNSYVMVFHTSLHYK